MKEELQCSQGAKKISVPMLITKIIIYAYLIIHIILLIVPFVWSIFTSLKDSVDFRYNKFGLPDVWRFSNYIEAFEKLEYTYIDSKLGRRVTSNFGNMMWNTIAYSFVVAAVSTIAKYIMAYITSVFNFKFNAVIDFIVIFTMTIPIYGSAPAELKLLDELNMIDNFFAITVWCKLSFLGLDYFIIKSCLSGVPKAFKESAEIDGASNFTILMRVYVPLTINIIVTLFVFAAISCWNDYQTPLLLLPSYPTMGFGLWKFKQVSGGTMGHVTMQLAGAWITIIPVIIVFLFMHDTLMGSISLAGGVKE